MNHHLKLNLKKNFITLRFLLDQYKLTICNNTLFNNKLLLVWFLFSYAHITGIKNLLKNKLLTSNNYRMQPNTIYHQVWLVTPLRRLPNLLLKKCSKYSIISVLPKNNIKQSYKKLYITTCCYNINRLFLSSLFSRNGLVIPISLKSKSRGKQIRLKNKLDTGFISRIFSYYFKLLYSNILYMYTLNINYLLYIRILRNTQWNKSLVFNDNLVTKSKVLTTHNLINHHLINL